MLRPVLILQHQTPERPAYLATWLKQHHIAYRTCCAAVEPFPSSIEPYAALAVMGGGMSANDPLVSNRQAEILILQAMRLGRPVIGHCLGGQLMSRALGSTIGASPKPEIGWHAIDYAQDPLVEHWFGTNPTPTVIQWHYESFGIPEGATLLASSASCANQAWALGPHLAMQFHIEMDEVKAREWAADDDAVWNAALSIWPTVQNNQQILEGIDPYLAQHQATAAHIYSTWLQPTEWACNS